MALRRFSFGHEIHGIISQWWRTVFPAASQRGDSPEQPLGRRAHLHAAEPLEARIAPSVTVVGIATPSSHSQIPSHASVPSAHEVSLAPAPSLTNTFLGVDLANHLVRFNSAEPDSILDSTSITGTTGGEAIVGIDFRPATGQLYGLGYNFNSIGTEGQLYVIDPLTAVAVPVGSRFSMPRAIGSTLNAATSFGFDFNPVTDEVRIVSSGRDDFRVDPTTGVAAGRDTLLTGPVVGSAYSDNFGGALATTLFGIDANADTLVRQGGPDGTPSPNTGQLTLIGSLGVDAVSNLGFDIFTAPDGTNLGFVALSTDGTGSGLYQINLSTGAATFVGNIGSAPTLLRAFTVSVDPPPSATFDARHPVTFYDANHDLVTVRLTGSGSGTVTLQGGVSDGADISAIHLQGTGLDSAVTISIAKSPTTGDGFVGVDAVTVDGSLKSFIAPNANLTGDGFASSGPVKTITVHDLLAGQIVTGGAAANALALTVHSTSDGTSIHTTQTISALKSVTIGSGTIEAAAFGRIVVSAGDLTADVHSAGRIANIQVRGGGVFGDIDARSFGPVTITGGDFSGLLSSTTPAASLGATKALSSVSITGGDFTGEVTLLGKSGTLRVKNGSFNGEITADSFGAVSVTNGDFTGELTSLASAADLGSAKALSSFTVTGGDFTGVVDLLGESGPINIRGGDLTGILSAGDFRFVSVTGGDFSGSLSSLTPASALSDGEGLGNLTVTGGNLTGHVRVLGSINTLAVRAKVGVGGNMNGATIAGSDIVTFTVTGNLVDSIVLAGADLGSDFALGGAEDTFGAGTIGIVTVKGNVAGASVIGAGLSSANTAFKDADDTIIGGASSFIKNLHIVGTASTDSYFAAGRFVLDPRIHEMKVKPATDPRFKLG